MQIETLKRSHLKRNILIAVVVVAIISAVILNFTRAKYRTTESIPLITGKITYTLADLNIVAMYIGEEEIETLPDGNYTLTSESYCTNSANEKDESLTLSYDSDTQGLSVSPMKEKGTKCYLYFEEKASGSSDILANEGGIDAIIEKGTPDFSQVATTDEGMYAAEDDWGTSYYYRGAVNDNWMQFGTNSSGEPLYWRIIRINGDGTIRLIYNGTSTVQTGTSTQIQTSAFNSSTGYNMYVGYMYGGGVHGLQQSSTIKGILDTWYQNNLTDEANYIEGSTGFCGDRTPSTSASSSNGLGGTGTTDTYYGAYIRLNPNKIPTLECPYEDGNGIKQDLYTTSMDNQMYPNPNGQGNQALTYPVGLITADEVLMAGVGNGSVNRSYYLYTGQYYWTMSPFFLNNGYVDVFYVDVNGVYSGGQVTTINVGVRPVINIRSDVAITGTGSVDDPYKIA